MARKVLWFLVLFGAISIPAAAYAQSSPPAPPPEIEQVNEALTEAAESRIKERSDDETLQTLSDFANFIRDAEASEQVTAEEAEALRDVLVRLSGPYGDFDIEGLERYNSRHAVTSWVKILMIGACLLGAVGFILFVSLIMQSVVVVEGCSYLVAGALMFASSSFLGADAVWGTFCGLLIFSITFSCSYGLRAEAGNRVTLILSVLAVIWAAFAIPYQSQLFGFISVAALEGLLGFAILPIGIGYLIGWEDEDEMSRGTAGSFAFLVIGVLLFVSQGAIDAKALWFMWPFINGLLLLGSLVMFIGLLIMGSRWFKPSKMSQQVFRRKVFFMNFATIALSLGCMYVGTVYSVPFVVGVATWLLFFWALERWIEISFNELTWALSFLGAAGMLYGLAKLMEWYPDYFVLWA
jgi:hypothetical protein